MENDNIENPFIINGYFGGEYFCDRKKELKILKDNAENGILTTMISDRKIGKTWLIYRFFDSLNEESDQYVGLLFPPMK